MFIPHIVVHVENVKESTTTTKKNPSNNGNYSKIAGNKVNIKKCIAFLFTSNKQLQLVIKTHYISTKNINYIGITLTKYLWDLYE